MLPTATMETTKTCLWAVFLLLVAGTVAGTAVGDDKADSFARALQPREFLFPRDHASHPDFKTEWWYFTGSLETETGQPLGFQATWFRSALVSSTAARPSPLAVRDVFFFHGALSDVDAAEFIFDHVASRGGAGWAAASEVKPQVHVLENRMELDSTGVWKLHFEVQGRRFDLQLSSAAQSRPLLHGESQGLSRKGAQPGQASYYVSLPRLQVEGRVERRVGEPLRVRGTAWFDHEFGAGQLPEELVGWDWFSVALDDGTDLMVYSLRRKDGARGATADPASSGTVRYSDGRRVHLPQEAFTIEVDAYWRSPHSLARYPAQWRLRIPQEKIDLKVRPRLADQELRTQGSTGIAYWEGLCSFDGKVGSRRVRSDGYVELVGYAGSFRAEI